MDHSTLRDFSVIAQLENMTKAAEVLHISQSSLSNEVDKLEGELGHDLFERKGKKLRLNDYGKLLASTAKELAEDYTEGIRTLQEMHTTSGTIHIAMIVENDGFFTLLKDFQESYPGIGIHLTSTKAAVKDLLATNTDFFVMPWGMKEDLPFISIARRGNLYVLMSSKHPLASERVLTFEDIQQERFAFSFAEKEMIEPVFKLCLQAGFRPNVSFLYNDSQFQLEMVLQSNVITIAYNTFRQFRQKMNGIASIPLVCSQNLSSDIVFAWRKETINPVADLLSEFAQRYRIQ